jgi:hypothetical protein
MDERATRAEFDHACLLVGRFMYQFALLEAAVDNAIGNLLRIRSLENQILVRNIEFSRKINILKSAVSLGGKKEEKGRLLNRIAKVSEIRNVIAHNVFGPDKGGIRFLTVAAKSELKFPETFYTEERFGEMIREMIGLGTKLDAMVKEIEKPSANVLAAMMQNATNPPV